MANLTMLQSITTHGVYVHMNKGLWLTIACIWFMDMQVSAMPTYKEVAAHFKSHYAPTIPDSVSYSLRKDVHGWHLVTRAKYLVRTVYAQSLFWSHTTKSYVILSLPKLQKNKSSGSYHFHMPEGVEAYCFERCLFYGYSGWDDDIIQTVEHMPSYSDTLLESLARAYINKGLSHLWSQFEYYSSPVGCPDSKRDEYISNPCIDQYISYTSMGVACYKKLSEKNPFYETIVGIALTKYAMESFYAYHTLGITQRVPKHKNPFLREGLFNQALLNMGYSILNSVDSNAILFTNGDLDTYITLYLQAVLGYRTDVSIVNLGLLNLPRFTWSLYKENTYHTKLDMTLSESTPLSSLHDFYYLDKRDGPSDSGVWQVQDWLRIINDTLNTERYYDVDHRYLAVPSSKLYYNINQTPLAYELQDNYLLRGQAHMLDIIATNGNTRPIYFSFSADNSIRKPFNEHLWVTGFAYKISPETHATEGMYFNQEELGRHIKNGLPWYDSASAWVFNYSPFKEFTNNYRLLFSKYTEFKLESENRISAQYVLALLNKNCPLSSNNCNVYCIAIIENYLKLDQKDEAMKYAENYFNYIENQIRKQGKNIDKVLKQEIDYMVYILYEANLITASNQWRSLLLPHK